MCRWGRGEPEELITITGPKEKTQFQRSDKYGSPVLPLTFILLFQCPCNSGLSQSLNPNLNDQIKYVILYKSSYFFFLSLFAALFFMYSHNNLFVIVPSDIFRNTFAVSNLLIFILMLFFMLFTFHSPITVQVSPNCL